MNTINEAGKNPNILSKKLVIGLGALVIVAAVVFLVMYGNKKDKAIRPPVVTDITETVMSEAGMATNTEPLLQVLGNLSYGLKQPQTKLVNGYFVGKFEDCGGRSCNGVTYYSHMKLSDIFAVGDLNGDGEKDAVAVVGSVTTQSPKIDGVQYTRQDIAAMVKQGDSYKNVAAIELTDDLSAVSTAVEKLSIKNGIIYVTVLKNLGSMNLSYPTATEEIQLKLDPSSASGFALMKNGIQVNSDEFVPVSLTKVAVSGSGTNKILVLSGNGFAMFKNAVILTPKGSGGPSYESIIVGSSKNNSGISIPLSNVGFPTLGGNVSSKPYDVRPIPAGTYDVSAKIEVCTKNLPCQIIVSNAVEVKI